MFWIRNAKPLLFANRKRNNRDAGIWNRMSLAY